MPNDIVRDSYRWHRLRSYSATRALELARADAANGKRRYPGDGRSYLSRQPDAPHMAFADPPSSFGLRHVGDVNPESRWGYWNTRADRTGWYTDPNGDVFRDGTGLCWGVVYQLPARDGRARFVAGYQNGGDCAGPMLDLGTIYESERGGAGSYSSARDDDAAHDAARAANGMAERAAESEREYQTAWQAGSRWAELGDEIAAERKAALALLAERRKARATDAASFPAICATIRARIEGALERINEARDARRKLAEGDYRDLIFYPGEAHLRDAFNAGADAAVLT